MLIIDFEYNKHYNIMFVFNIICDVIN